MALPKLFQRIIFHNNTTPAINEDNLNAISKAIDDIDDRIIELAADILEKVPIILDKYEDIEELTENPPYIGANGNWYVWDASATPPGYVDSGVDASITVNIADITMLAPDATPYVTNTGTNTDPIFHLFLPRGVKGDNGVSPGITITTIAGGHRVTITDADHPTGQSFDVMDGESGATTFAGLSDVNINTQTLADGDIPIYDETAQKWKNGRSSGGMATDGSNAASHVTFSGAFTVGSRRSGSTVGARSTAFGGSNTASEANSHAEGYNTTASGNSSHAEGSNTTASGFYSHAEGQYTIAGHTNQHACGKYNSNKSTTLMEVGNGTSTSARSNAFEVYADGSLSTDNGATKTKLPVIKSKPLVAGATSVIFDNMPSSGNNLIQFYTSKPGLDYTAITTSGTNTTLTYPAQSSSTTVYCSIVEVM